MKNIKDSELLGNKYIRVTMLAGLFSQLGIWIRNFAVLLFIMEHTNNNPVAVSWIYIAEYVPIFIFSFVGGTFADRWPPRKTIIICDTLSALSVMGVLLALLGGNWKMIFCTTLLSAVFSQFSQPSGMKLFKMHVPEKQVQTAMSLYQAMNSIFMVLGPAIGTFVYKQCGIYISIGIVSFAFLLQGLMMLLLPADRPVARSTTPNFWREFKEGFGYVYHSPILRHLGIAFALGGFAVGAVQPLFIFIIVEKLQLPKEFIQWFTTVNGVAMIAGGALVIWISKYLSPQKILAIGNISCAVINVITGFSTQVFLIFVLQFIGGFILPFIMVGINTIVMKSSDSSFVGRVNGVFSPIYIGSMLIMLSMSGWLKLQLSLEGMYVLSGVLFLVATLVIFRMFRLDFQSSSSRYGRNEVASAASTYNNERS